MSELVRQTNSRRGFLGWTGRVGVSAIAAAAGVIATSPEANASHGGCHTVGCCCLWHPSSSGCSNICNNTQGFWAMRSWTCCSGSGAYRCWECTKSTSCWTGPFLCSFAQKLSGGSC